MTTILLIIFIPIALVLFVMGLIVFIAVGLEKEKAREVRQLFGVNKQMKHKQKGVL